MHEWERAGACGRNEPIADSDGRLAAPIGREGGPWAVIDMRSALSARVQAPHSHESAARTADHVNLLGAFAKYHGDTARCLVELTETRLLSRICLSRTSSSNAILITGSLWSNKAKLNGEFGTRSNTV
ncbi:hypothetical protein chiPu_0012796 [Chiloscyllium punctatum]|uniref:Uncharacterized protein n=1 Tax=Chiloscyllium punctatum TaxID=137246 RepID=A0A401SVC9_CHIPU|nr:hypothetical protein [Chiloscyllium punctatum]